MVCERAFLPDELAEHERLAAPVLSLESQRPLSAFDCIAFSTTYENDYLHLLRILQLSGIPLRAEERGPGHPLVSMGGVCAWSNPEPLAPFLDWVFLGEGEESGPEVFSRWRALREAGPDAATAREAFFRELLDIEGVYVPGRYTVREQPDGTVAGVLPQGGAPLPVRKRILRQPDTVQTISAVRTPDTEFGDMGLIEVGRGCGRGCRFCLEGEIYRPVRHRHLEAVLAAADALASGGPRVGLVGACLSDYPWLEELLAGLRARGMTAGVSSLRADRLTTELLQALVGSGTRTITLAPEAGTDRLRAVIRKGLTDDQICRAAERAADAGLAALKLYFMLGLPTETDEDVDGIMQLAKQVRHRLLRARRQATAAPDVTVGVSCFVPKPWTPFQWCGMAEVKRLEESLDRLRRGFRKAGIRFTHDVPKWAYLQAVLARGDRHVADLLGLALHHKGEWRKAFREWPRNGDFYAARARPLHERFPWDHLDVGADRGRLEAEYRRAMDAEATA
ncbi:MAG: radical SAM protein [Candidatus Methylomirabilales bacterium]